MQSDELYHYRTKGSKNGISTDPNYTPIGQRAQGPAYLPGSTANRQYREQQQQASRMRIDEGIKRLKSSATSTANSAISGVNSAARKVAAMQEDATIRRDLERQRKEKEKEARRQARRKMLDRGLDRLKKSTVSSTNTVLKKSGMNLRISDKRGVGPNPYEQGYTGVSRAQRHAMRRAKQQQERMKQAHEDAKAGKYGKLAAAKAYGKEGFEAASKIAKDAKRTLSPSALRQRYWKTRGEIGRTISDAKRDMAQSSVYKKTKDRVSKISSAAKSTMDKAAKSAQNAQKRASNLYERSKPSIDEVKTKVKEKASEAATAVGTEAERLKRKGLSLLKKLRK